ncbi:MAG: TraR/DksA family transcriptional regulator [Planctomycetaceae bacterium]|jgi:RNA polymerase-binding protein DksA|nr:TraR/DksA family transcriptional regulator [Planctomycetaceae bacterium]
MRRGVVLMLLFAFHILLKVDFMATQKKKLAKAAKTAKKVVKKSASAATKKKVTTKSNAKKTVRAAKKTVKTVKKAVKKTVKKVVKKKVVTAVKKKSTSVVKAKSAKPSVTATKSKKPQPVTSRTVKPVVKPTKPIRPAVAKPSVKSATPTIPGVRETVQVKQTVSEHKKQLEGLRQSLLKRRDDIKQFLESETGIGDRGIATGDIADMAVAYSEAEKSYQFVETKSRELKEIERAIQRMEEGGYGICEKCGGEIPVMRLEVLPFTSKCVRCVEAEERARQTGYMFDD